MPAGSWKSYPRFETSCAQLGRESMVRRCMMIYLPFPEELEREPPPVLPPPPIPPRLIPAGDGEGAREGEGDAENVGGVALVTAAAPPILPRSILGAAPGVAADGAGARGGAA